MTRFLNARIEFVLGVLVIVTLVTVATAQPADARFRWPKFRDMSGWPVFDFTGDW